MTNVVDVCVNYLQRAVDAGYDLLLIRTIRGIGYRIGSNASFLKIVFVSVSFPRQMDAGTKSTTRTMQKSAPIVAIRGAHLFSYTLLA
jgi:DNA-binding winged helix-turn-helix (wHTH) protein